MGSRAAPSPSWGSLQVPPCSPHVFKGWQRASIKAVVMDFPISGWELITLTPTVGIQLG